jgi:hypothetical protein
LEHVAITILFFGGGLVSEIHIKALVDHVLIFDSKLGLLIESNRIRKFLNTALLQSQPLQSDVQLENSDSPTPKSPTWNPPVTSTVPLNPMPALTIMLLGIIMSAHSQESMLSSALHSYWGTLFCFAGAARMTTYILNYLRPPVSYLPSRPPSEILAGFCLVAGGLLFMISASDIVASFEASGWHGMVAFTVGMGAASVICAGAVGIIAAKGLALARETPGRRKNANDAAARVWWLVPMTDEDARYPEEYVEVRERFIITAYGRLHGAV